VKAKGFEIIPDKLPSGRPPASARKNQLGRLLALDLDRQAAAIRWNALVAPAGFAAGKGHPASCFHPGLVGRGNVTKGAA